MNYSQELLQRDGRACYKRKEYQKAVVLFDRAIRHAPSVQLLDNRASCHDKLGDLPAALKDAKKAIQLQREDPTGYLRAGKVLVKMEKLSVALEIYTHGLKVVKHVGLGYDLLRKVYGELLSRVSPPTSVDPLAILPRELAETVMEYLTFQQRINACRVSKEWAVFIRSTPNLWRHLDLSAAKRRVRSAFISRAVDTGREKILRATLSELQDFDQSLVAILQNCPLEELSLLDTGFHVANFCRALRYAGHLKSLRFGPGTEIGAYPLASMISICSLTLETLECTLDEGQQFHNFTTPCKKLKTFKITVPGGRSGPAIFYRTLHQFTPNLQSLTFHTTSKDMTRTDIIRLDGFKLLQHLDLNIPMLNTNCLRLPPSLTSLIWTVRGIQSLDFFVRENNGLGMATFQLPHLQDLSIDIGTRHGVTLVQYFLNNGGIESEPNISSNTTVTLSKIRQLTIKSSIIDIHDLEALFGHSRLQNVLQLTLQPPDALNDRHVDLIAAKLPKLQQLNLSGSDITGVGVKELLSRGQITHLVLNNCRMLSRDAVDWARSQGVHVEYRLCDGLSRGKKVRY